MEFSEQILDDIVILSFTGVIMGGSDSHRFQQRVYQGVEDGQINFVIDLSGASWMNSSGLGMLIAGLTTLRSSGGDLRLANLSERLLRPLEMTRLDSVFQIFDSVQKAIDSFR